MRKKYRNTTYIYDYIDEKLFNSLYADAEEIMRMLTASIITVQKRLKNNTISAKRAHH